MELNFSAPVSIWEKVIGGAAQKAIAAQVRLKIPRLRDAIAQHTRKIINASPAITSMLGGQLQAEFGFIQPQSVVSKLLNVIERAIEVNYQEKEFILEIILNKDVILRSGIGEYKTRNGDVPWLEWLLSSGGNTVIYGWHIEYGIFPKKSLFAGNRSGKARMVPGGSYAVGKFAGTKERNFITDAFDQQAIKELTNIIVSILE